jgi:hypothetical protein
VRRCRYTSLRDMLSLIVEEQIVDADPGRPQRSARTPDVERQARGSGLMPVRLALFNPSQYPRRGHVTVDWETIRDRVPIKPEELVIRDDAGRRLPCQLDPDPFDPDPANPKTLSFTLADELRSVGRDDYDPAYPAAHVTLDRLAKYGA